MLVTSGYAEVEWSTEVSVKTRDSSRTKWTGTALALGRPGIPVAPETSDIHL